MTWKAHTSALLMTDRINGGDTGVSIAVEQDKSVTITISDLKRDKETATVTLDRNQARSLKSLLSAEKI